MKLLLIPIAGLALAGTANAQLTNTGFDVGFVASGGQAELPAPWSSTGPGNTFISFDTWDHTNANGLAPAFANVFTGVTAATGTRWAGGWNFEDMHQLMGFTLTPGQQYTISAFVHAANANASFLPGGFQFALATTPTSTPTVVATFPVVNWASGWVLQSATFTAPANAATLPYFLPQAYSSNSAVNTYVGIDDVRLTLVPAPGTLALLGLGGAVCVNRRRETRPR